MSGARAVSADELAALRPLCDGASVIEEGGATYVYLPRLNFTSMGEEHTMEAALVPQMVPALGGYTTRLLLDHVTRKPLNWTVVTVLGRPWSTWSWNGVPAEAPLVEILANHLRALQ